MWVTEKGGPCDPFAKTDAGGTPATKLLPEYRRNLHVHSEEFTKYFHRSPDQLGPEHIRQYQVHLFRERKLSSNSVRQRVAALRFFFVKTLRRHYMLEHIPFPKEHRPLPIVLSQEEVAQLIDSASNLLHRAMLMTLDATGTRVLPSIRREGSQSLAVRVHELSGPDP